MLKIRIQYLRSDELEAAIKALEKDFDIVYLNREAKKNNPKYANSKYKTAYADVQLKE